MYISSYLCDTFEHSFGVEKWGTSEGHAGGHESVGFRDVKGAKSVTA